MNPIYEVKNLYFSYAKNLILENISIQIPTGKLISIIGPNGGGKTTFLKILLGILPVQKGEVLYKGEKLNNVLKENFKVGYLPQLSTHEAMNQKFLIRVKEILELGINKKVSKNLKKQLIDKNLALFNIEPIANELFLNLSGGLKQRVLLARALINSPEILMLDEPSTGVDSDNQGHLFNTLKHLNQNEGMTILMVTHDLNIVPAISYGVACLNRKLYFHTNPDEFFTCPVMEEQLESALEVIVHGENIPHRLVGNHQHNEKGDN